MASLLVPHPLFARPDAETEKQIALQPIRPWHRVFAQHGVESPMRIEATAVGKV
jgi:hypothetical protein